MAIAFKGITKGDRYPIFLRVDTEDSIEFETNYKEEIESTRVTSEKWNGTAYQRIHRVVRAWKKYSFNTGKISGTRAEADEFVNRLIKSTNITLTISSLGTPFPVTLESQNLMVSDSKNNKGYSLDLVFKTSEEV